MLQERVATHRESRGESQGGSGASNLEGNQCRLEQEEGRAPGEGNCFGNVVTLEPQEGGEEPGYSGGGRESRKLPHQQPSYSDDSS